MSIYNHSPGHLGRLTRDPLGAESTKLDAFNDKYSGGYLHPTRGYKSRGVASTVAAMITAEIKSGVRWTLADIGARIREARAA